MELWIRSQDRGMLYKPNELFLDFRVCEELGIKEYYVNVNHETFGTYKTKERALEVLDEIQQSIKNKYIIKSHQFLKEEAKEKLQKLFTNNYSGEFILQSPTCDIEPINSDTILYEMPKK